MALVAAGWKGLQRTMDLFPPPRILIGNSNNSIIPIPTTGLGVK
jgi:hypothetical protein